MNRFLIVLRYELREYFSSKVFMVLTAVLALAGIILLFLPRFVDMSGFTGVNVIGKADEAQEETDPGERPLLLYVDQTCSRKSCSRCFRMPTCRKPRTRRP